MELAYKYIKEEDYLNAIKIYDDLLVNDEYNLQILSNRTLAYIKIGNYKKALIDAIYVAKNNQKSAKAWGRLGASLYGITLKSLNKSNQKYIFKKLVNAKQAYSMAYKLEQSKIYLKMISDIDIQLNMINYTNTIENVDYITESTKIPEIESLLNCFDDFFQKVETSKPIDNIFNSANSLINLMSSNTNIMSKLNNEVFQNKVLTMANNPFGALQDPDIMTVLAEMIKDISKLN